MMFLFVSPTGAQQLLIVLRLQMRTAILLCTCIYIQYGKKCVCVCVCVCVCAHVMCVGISRFVLSSLHLYCSLFTVIVYSIATPIKTTHIHTQCT